MYLITDVEIMDNKRIYSIPLLRHIQPSLLRTTLLKCFCDLLNLIDEGVPTIRLDLAK